MFGFSKRELVPRLLSERYVPIWVDCAAQLSDAANTLFAARGCLSKAHLQDVQFEAFVFSVASTMITLALGIEDGKWKWHERSVELYLDQLEDALVTEYSWESRSYSTMLKHGDQIFNERLAVYNQMFFATLDGKGGPLRLSRGFQVVNQSTFGDREAQAMLVQLYLSFSYLAKKYPTLPAETQLMFVHQPVGATLSPLFRPQFDKVFRIVVDAFAQATTVAKAF